MRFALLCATAALLAVACGASVKEQLQAQPIGVHQAVVVSQPAADALPAPAVEAASTKPPTSAPQAAPALRPGGVNAEARPELRCNGAGRPAPLCPPP